MLKINNFVDNIEIIWNVLLDKKWKIYITYLNYIKECAKPYTSTKAKHRMDKHSNKNRFKNVWKNKYIWKIVYVRIL